MHLYRLGMSGHWTDCRQYKDALKLIDANRLLIVEIDYAPTFALGPCSVSGGRRNKYSGFLSVCLMGFAPK